MEEMTRTTKVIFDYFITGCDGEIEAVITNSSGDYGYGPELDTLKIIHRTDAYEVCVYTDQRVDEDFDLEEVKQLAEKFAKEYLSPEEN